MNIHKLAIAAAVSLLCAACATPTSRTAEPASKEASAGASAKKTTQSVKSRDGSYSGEVVGTPVPGSKFAKLQIGMNMAEVQDILGQAPDRSHTYESGKRWIPFYFGNDARRVQAWFKGEGCVIVTGGNVWGGAGGDLIQIEHDASGACYQP